MQEMSTDRSISLGYNFCVNSPEAAPNSHRAKHHRQMGNISFMLLRRNLTKFEVLHKQLLNDKKMETPVRGRVETCFQLYSLAIFDAKEAFQDYNAKRYHDSNTRVSAVSNAPVTCEDGFKEIQGLVSPLIKMNNVTYRVSAISLAIVTMFSLE
ncbi:Mitochondrial acyl carrier protein 1 [Hibiscus syriacus]|uniref:Mitochondrial acyl carrier protein 1 n=1 Tax=Hibiscus syriacus TaxID=106335 RepID=A0A6A2XNW1_HIBSY|nr:putative invertase inhibitor [Hibiscus syriacus]KAE8677463.1 Mitochondrial acyl carrier protein 1 [Hibiscus syriacus]